MIVFDLDGTLVDSLPDIANALIAALRDRGHRIPDRAEVRTWIGGGARELVRQAVPDDVEPTLDRFQHHYRATPVAETVLYPGIAELLDEIARPVAILSNKPHELTVRIADALLGRWTWHRVLGGRPRVPLKPAPDAALDLIAGLDPKSTWLVGDSPSDIHTARAAGMRAAAVTWGYRPRAELVAAAPDAVLDDVTGLSSTLRA